MSLLLSAGLALAAQAPAATGPDRELLDRAAVLSKEPLQGADLPPAELDAYRATRDGLVDKMRRLVEKAREVRGTIPELEREQEALREEAARLREQPPPPAGDMEAAEQAVELARYQVQNRKRRLDAIDAEIASVRDRVAEAERNLEAARARQAELASRAADAGAPGQRARIEIALASAQEAMESYRRGYLADLTRARELRRALARTDIEIQEALLAKRLDDLALLQSRAGVRPEEASRQVEALRARQKALDTEIAALDAPMAKAVEAERHAEHGIRAAPRARPGAPPSAEETSVARTHLDTAIERKRALQEQLSALRLERQLLEERVRTWQELAEASQGEPLRRERAARRIAEGIEVQRAHAAERRAALARLIELARDDGKQIEDGIAYSRARIAADDEDDPNAAARRAAIESAIASLTEAAEHSRDRLEALEDQERVLAAHEEALAEALRRLAPFTSRARQRVTWGSFAALGKAASAALQEAALTAASPSTLAGALEGSLGRLAPAPGTAHPLRRSGILALLGIGLAVVLGRALGRLASRAPDRTVRRGLLTLAAQGTAPLLVAALILLALVPLLPDAPPSGDTGPQAFEDRLARTFLGAVALAAGVAGVLLAAAALRRAAAASALPDDAVLRLTFTLRWARLAAVLWLLLDGAARLGDLWGADPAVPFLLSTLGRLVVLAASALVAVRLRGQIEHLLEVHHLGRGEEADGLLAHAYNRFVHFLFPLTLVYFLSLLGVYLMGYGELAALLLWQSLQTFGVVLAAFGASKLAKLFVEGRLDELDRVEALTGRPHLVERESYRLLFAVAVAVHSLLALTATLAIWGESPEEAWLDALRLLQVELVTIGGQPITPRSLLTFAAIVVSALVLSRILRRFLASQVFPRSRVDKGVQLALATLLNYAILCVALFVGFQAMGFDLTTLKVIAGAVGLGIGFGLQNIAANFISGLIILLERPVNPDDVVEVGGTLGRVETVTSRATLLRTRDNITVIVPNTELVNGRVVNWSHRDPRLRIHVPVGVAYGTDVDRLREVLLSVATSHPEVIAVPAPELRFTAFGESALQFDLLAWVKDPWNSERIVSDLHFATDAALRQAGIVIPFPQRVVHVEGPPLR